MKDLNLKNIAFVGQFVSMEDSLNDVRISQAGNNYQLKFIRMLGPVFSISIFPIFTRFKTKSIFENTVHQINSNSPFNGFLHNIYRLFLDTFKSFKLLYKSKVENIFFYNLDKQNVGLVLLSKYFLKRKVFIVLADHSNFNNASFFDKWMNKVLKNLDGVIVLNSNTQVNINQKVLPGLIEKKKLRKQENKGVNKNVLFSGSLGKTTGLELALEAFSKRSDINLKISGRPYKYTDDEFYKLIDSYSSKYPNIEYLGLLPYEDYLDVLMDCDVTLSLRNPLDIEHQFNFPSKILEYLSMSKLVISSLDYPDLSSQCLFKSEFDVASLIDTIDKIYNLEEDEIDRLKTINMSYLENNFTEVKLDKICQELINFSA